MLGGTARGQTSTTYRVPYDERVKSLAASRPSLALTTHLALLEEDEDQPEARLQPGMRRSSGNPGVRRMRAPRRRTAKLNRRLPKVSR
jgi:hypothetical protein